MRLTHSGAEKLAVSTPIDPTRMEVRCDRLTVYFRFKVFPCGFWRRTTYYYSQAMTPMCAEGA